MRFAVFLFCAVAAVSFLTVSASEPAFDFKQYLVGEWDVQKSTVSTTTHEQSFSSLVGRYAFRIDNETSNLIGEYYDNDTTTFEVSNQLEVSVEFTDPVSGTFKTGADINSDHTPLFHFNFEDQEYGMSIAHGEWLGRSGGLYQFIAMPRERFVLTIYPKDGKSDIQVLTGRKVPQVVERTFFQKYGTFIMFGVFILFQTFFSGKQQQRMMEQAATPGTDTAAPARARPTAETATVEEEPEDDSSTGSKADGKKNK